MATVTFTKQVLMTLIKFRPIPGLATGYAPFLEEDRCLPSLQLQCSANRSLAFASVFKFGHFSLGDAEELSLMTKALTSFMA